MAETKISQLTIAPSFKGSEYIIIDNGEVTRRTTIDSLTSVYAYSGAVSAASWNAATTVVQSSSAAWSSAYTLAGESSAALLSSTTWNASSSEVQASSATWMINVETYGVIGNGTTNVSQSMAHALSSNPAGGTMYFPAGVYNFDTFVLIPNNNLTIVLDNNAILRTTNRRGKIPVDNRCIFIVGASNFTITGGILSGDWDMSYQGTGQVERNQEITGSIIQGALSFTDYYASRTTNVENIRVENVTFSRGSMGYINIYANTSSTGRFRNFHFHNNKFLECLRAPIGLANYKQTIAQFPVLSSYDRLENIFITNNVFDTTGKSQPHWNGPNDYNPQGMGLYNSYMYARDGVYVTTIPSTNMVSMSGLKFDNTSIGYIYKIPPEYIGTLNRANGGTLYSYLSSASTTSSVCLGLTSVNPNGTAQFVVLSSAFKQTGSYFDRWTPIPTTFTGVSQISGSNIQGQGFQMIEHSLAYDASYSYPLGAASNFIGSVGQLANIVVENNYFNDCGKHGLELYGSQHSENTVVRNNIFKNIPYYVFSFGGINTTIESNTFENCSPVLELYGTQVAVQNNYWKNGGMILPLRYNSYGTDIVNFSNNFINANPKDTVSISDFYGFEVHSVVVENNVIQYPHGMDVATSGTAGIFNFQFTENLMLRNNTLSITGPVSGFYWTSVPPVFVIGGKNVIMENNSFLLSGYGGTEGGGSGPGGFAIFNSLFNSRIYNNSSNCKLPVKLPVNIPIWGFSSRTIYEGNAPKVALFDGARYVSYALSGYPGYKVWGTGAPVDAGPAYPTNYNIGDLYIVNPVTDFTSNTCLSAWNINRNKIAKYAGSGTWTYYDIADVIHYDTTSNYNERTLDEFINSEHPVVNFKNKAFIINTSKPNCVFSNVTFENNNFTFYDAVSSMYGTPQTGLSFQYPLMNNFKIIGNKDTVNFTNPILNLNSDVETNGNGLVLASSTGARYKVIMTTAGVLSSTPI